MKTKTITAKNGKTRKLNKFIHFGYKIKSQSTKGDRTTYVLQYEANKEATKGIKILKKDYKKVKRCFPTGAFIHGLIGCALYFGPHYISFFETFEYTWTLPLLAICFWGAGIYRFLVFLFIQLKGRRFKKDIITQGDQFTGNAFAYPYNDGVAKSGKDSYILRQYVTSKRLRR